MSAPATAPVTVTVTYFIEIMSSWCHWAEPTWDELKTRYAGQVHFQWRIALMRPEDFPVSAAQCDWFYRRSGTHVGSPVMLNSGWLETDRAGDYRAPNWVAEAARSQPGGDGDGVRRALSEAAMLRGEKIGDLATAVRIAAAAGNLDATRLQTDATSEAVRQRVTESTEIFFAHQLGQRPSFLLESTIGDKAVLSGTWTAAPVAAALDAMLEDFRRYDSHRAHFGDVPEA